MKSSTFFLRSEIKKKWLRSWIHLCIFQACIGIPLLFVQDKFSCAAWVSSLFWLYAVKRCAYNSPGNKVLKWFVFWNCFGLLKVAYSYIKEFSSEYSDSFELLLEGAIIFWFSIAIVGFTSISLKLMTSNEKILKKKPSLPALKYLKNLNEASSSEHEV